MTDDTLATRYQPNDIEKKWYRFWEENHFFRPRGEGEPYAIMIPPPNVTGTLHMGHAFQDTIMDTLIRYQRMNGKNTLWQPGCDHAGIATQMVVERKLNAKGKTRHDLGREAFTEAVWAWKNESGGQIMQQLRRLGASLDWERERFTMDDDMSRAVRQLFIKLYDEGLIYRGQRLVNWDPVLKTAISDLEVEKVDEKGFMYHVRYPFAPQQGLDGQFLTIATTRPETIPADVAVAVNPNDSRYQALIGKKVLVPFGGREIPIIADDYVEAEFGTGCLKITPAHDFNDYAVGKRHQLAAINLFHPDATLNDNAPAAFRGLDRDTARDKMVAQLQADGLLAKVEPHDLKRPRGDRTGAVIEPYLTDQWFVDLSRETQPDGRAGGYQRLTKPALDAVREGKICFVPQNWERTYFNWLENLEDWCISRQLWWGHRIPAWYDDAGQIYVAEDEAQARQKYHLPADLPLRQEEDVLDTWFSSALWPFSTLGWGGAQDDDALKTFYPTSVLVTGFDIIFFWVARMVLMGLYCMDGAVPFREVYIHGLVRDSEGQKMSKTKGNVLDPLDIIDGIDLDSLLAKRTASLIRAQDAPKIAAQTEKMFPNGITPYGTDALRFTFAAQATMGRDIVFDLQRVEGYRNFCNKLWNAARFVLMQTAEKDILPAPAAEKSPLDRWIYTELNHTITAVREAFDGYRFDFAAQAIYEFIWNKYCDWYLELAKVTVNADIADSEKAKTRHTLLDVLERALRLAHPLMPFITEEIWQKVAEKLHLNGQTIMLAPFPVAEEMNDERAVNEMLWLQNVLLGVRKIRAEMNISPGKMLPLVLGNVSTAEEETLAGVLPYLQKLGRIAEVTIYHPEAGEEPEAAAFMVGALKVMIPLAGLIDKAAELQRLNKEIDKLSKNIAKLSGQLSNERFLSKAPADLVEKTKQILQTDKENLNALETQRMKVAAMPD